MPESTARAALIAAGTLRPGAGRHRVRDDEMIPATPLRHPPEIALPIGPRLRWHDREWEALCELASRFEERRSISTPADRRMVPRRPVKVATGRPCTGSFVDFFPVQCAATNASPPPLDPSSNAVGGAADCLPLPPTERFDPMTHNEHTTPQCAPDAVAPQCAHEPVAPQCAPIRPADEQADDTESEAD